MKKLTKQLKYLLFEISIRFIKRSYTPYFYIDFNLLFGIATRNNELIILNPYFHR